MTRDASIIAFWKELPPYAEAALASLSRNTKVEVVAVRLRHQHVKPFERSSENRLFHLIEVDEESQQFQSGLLLDDLVRSYTPLVVLVSGWRYRSLNQRIKRWHKQGAVTVLMFDNTWRGDIRQILGAHVLRYLVTSHYSMCFVPGDRAAKFARKIGFKMPRIVEGLYSCDTQIFKCDSKTHSVETGNFIFAGSLIERKGIGTLIKAYENYREAINRPWGLIVAGEGPLEKVVTGTGIRKVGFKQPSDLRDLMAESSVFVLPSLKEAWGVVIHEAASMGLPIICSRECGAARNLVTDGVNGIIFDAGDVDALTEAMISVSEMRELGAWSEKSLQHAKRYSPEKWVANLREGVAAVRPDLAGEIFE